MQKIRVKIGVLSILLLLFGVFPPQVAAQAEDEPVVFAVLFYSPTCPHCHEVITEHYPKMKDEFGEQFKLLFIDASTQQGAAFFTSACDAYNIPANYRGVPMMFLDGEVMIGSTQIPEQAPVLIREGLKNGGIGLPAIPGLEEAYQAALAQAGEQEQSEEAAEAAESASESEELASESEESAPEAEENPTESGGSAESLEAPGEEVFDAASATLSERFTNDLAGNSLAVIVLLGLLFTAVGITLSGVGSLAVEDAAVGRWLTGRPGWLTTLITAFVALAISITLIFQHASGPLAVPLAIIVASVLFLVFSVVLRRGTHQTATTSRRKRQQKAKKVNLPGWLIPVASLAGLLIAAYLAYVEVGEYEALCGVVGDCNAVQASPYARLFGLLPIGVMGIAGYIVILITWGLSQITKGLFANLMHFALLGMALFGVLFSIYLTFLEPFVIGATCAWCLTSAVVMALLLWLEAPDGWKALGALLRGED